METSGAASADTRIKGACGPRAMQDLRSVRQRERQEQSPECGLFKERRQLERSEPVGGGQATLSWAR